MRKGETCNQRCNLDLSLELEEATVRSTEPTTNTPLVPNALSREETASGPHSHTLPSSRVPPAPLPSNRRHHRPPLQAALAQVAAAAAEEGGGEVGVVGRRRRNARDRRPRAAT